MAPDHLFDLVSELCTALGAPPPMRFGAHEIFDARLTLVKAVQQLFAVTALPYFDLANADVTFSFGANFLETYLSPLAYSRGFAQMRRGKTGKRGYLVQFEPRLSQTAACADEWIPIAPGSEGLVALALGRLVAEIHAAAIPNAYLGVDVEKWQRPAECQWQICRGWRIFSPAQLIRWQSRGAQPPVRATGWKPLKLSWH